MADDIPNKALVIGIDDYCGSKRDLKGCVADARAVADRLKTHWDGEPNCQAITLTSETPDVNTENPADMRKDKKTECVAEYDASKTPVIGKRSE